MPLYFTTDLYDSIHPGRHCTALELKQSCHNGDSLAPLVCDVITRAIKTLFIVVEKELRGGGGGNDEDCTAVVDSAENIPSVCKLQVGTI